MKFDALIQQLAVGYLASKRYRMYTAQRTISHLLYEFCDHSSPCLSEVFTKSFLGRLEEYLLHRGCKRNTVSFYMVIIRGLYYVAVEQHKIEPVDDLFSHVFTGTEPTVKRAISADLIALIASADLSDYAKLEFCRDIFALSFWLQGISFIDLCYLRKSDIQGDVITYRRSKTKGLVTVGLIDAAREILDKYVTEDSPYLLPIITKSGKEGYTQYQSALRKQNRHLKKLAEHLGIQEKLTSYVARHSWATIAYHADVPVAKISAAMGHHSESVTRVYLDSFDQSQMAEVNLTVWDVVQCAFCDLQEDKNGKNNSFTQKSGTSGEKKRAGKPKEKGVPDITAAGSINKNVRQHHRDGHFYCKTTY